MLQTVLLRPELSPAFGSKAALAGGVRGVVLGETAFAQGEGGRRESLFYREDSNRSIQL
jgi:hypothetical protein